MSDYAIDSIGNTQSSGQGPSMPLGTLVQVDGKMYRYVYNTGSATITQYYAAMAAATNNYYVADTGSDLGDKCCIGVAATDIASKEYGFVCVGGIHSVRVSTTFATTGEALQAGAGVFTLVSNATDPTIGFNLQTTAAAGNMLAWIKIG